MDAGDVARPSLIRPPRRKVLLQQIVRHRQGMFRVRRRLESTGRFCTQALAAQAFSDPPPTSCQVSCEPGCASAPLAGLEFCAHLRIRHLARLRLFRWRPTAPSAVAAACRHREPPAHQANLECVPVRLDCHVLHFGCFAKYAAAFFRKAFFSSTRANSRLSCTSSDCIKCCACLS